LNNSCLKIAVYWATAPSAVPFSVSLSAPWRQNLKDHIISTELFLFSTNNCKDRTEIIDSLPTKKLLCFGATVPSGAVGQWARAPSFTRFLDHTKQRTTVGRTPLDGWSARRRNLYRTIHNNHNRQTSTIPSSERPQTYALDRAATGIAIKKPGIRKTNQRDTPYHIYLLLIQHAAA